MDYLTDMIHHGLYELFGDDVIDTTCAWHLYKNYLTPERKASLYGRGFTMTGLIDNDNIDRTDIENKIRCKYFDLVIFGNVWFNMQPYYDIALATYPVNKIIFLDGEDASNFAGKINEIAKKYLYFKRELDGSGVGNAFPENLSALKDYIPFENVMPIGFSFPKSKIVNRDLVIKTKDKSVIIPGKVYTYNDEQEYYNEYRSSRYAITTRKGGWDCLRHYEILANYCMPLFYDIDACPKLTMTFFPKQECLEYLKNNKASPDLHGNLLDIAFDKLNKYLTTEAMAKYMIDMILKINK
jgi:hypothetical protein